jgi:hypothetical protein
MKTAKFTKLERRVRDLASRRARRQLMRVPRSRFHKAYEDYIRWQAFVLWVRAVVDSEGRVPQWLEEVLRMRCPGFLAQRADSKKRRALDLQLRQWIDDQAFRFAKKEGWLDAVAFYGFRDARLEGIWGYSEHCRRAWKKRRPKSFPTFPEWWRSALKWKLQAGVTCSLMAKAGGRKRKVKRPMATI